MVGRYYGLPLEYGSTISYKLKRNCHMIQQVPLIGIYLKEMKTCPHKDFYANVHNNFIYNCQPPPKKNPGNNPDVLHQ